MEVVDDPARCPRPAEGTVVTIGAYDGVHLGHRLVISRVRALAAERGCASAVVTFDRHPALVVRPESAPKLLTDTATKLELLAATGLDYALVVHFDADRAREPAEEFVREVLAGCLAARAVVVGHDFHFGHRRGGNIELLARMGPELGFEAIGLELFTDGAGPPVSSTRIRGLLGAGDVAGAAALLGRPHRLRGTVAATLGDGVVVEVPGAYLCPPPGRYGGTASLEGGAPRPVLLQVAPSPEPGGPAAIEVRSAAAPVGAAVVVAFDTAG